MKEHSFLFKLGLFFSFGYTFHAASLLGNYGQFAFDRIEDTVVQADEIDNRMLQFEGGLAVTSFLLSGVYIFKYLYTFLFNIFYFQV